MAISLPKKPPPKNIRWKAAVLFSRFFTLVGTKLANDIVLEKHKKLSDERENSLSKLVGTLRTRSKDEVEQIEKMAKEAYDTQLQRKSAFETKGSAFLGAAAIAVSLISISMALPSSDTELNIVLIASSFSFFYSIVHFIAAGIASVIVIRGMQFYLASLDAMDEAILAPTENTNLKWLADRIVGNNINSFLLIIKGNWLFAAENHFIHGLISLGIGFLLLIFLHLKSV